MTLVAWPPVLTEHRSNDGFVEGANNQNPWGPEQGVFNAAYCASAASIVAYHHGVRWWSDAQFGEKGYAYSPYFVNGGRTHGCFMEDHSSSGAPCDLLPGDIVFFSWGNNGVADHTETVIAVYADGTFDTVGYNTGHPEGCHVPIRRDRKYLLGRLRMVGIFYGTDVPVPPPPAPTPNRPKEHKMFWLLQIPGEDAWYWTDFLTEAHVVSQPAAKALLRFNRWFGVPVVCNATFDGPALIAPAPNGPFTPEEAPDMITELRELIARKAA